MGFTMGAILARSRPPVQPSERRLQLLYPLPDPMVSLEEWERSTHADLASMDLFALERERYRARHRYYLEARPHPWLARRLEAIRAELRRRDRRP